MPEIDANSRTVLPDGASEDVVPEDGLALSPYHLWYRSDILAYVPPKAKTVLSVGCACGITEAELVRRGAQVVGVELDARAAAAARRRGLTVFEGDACTIHDPLGQWCFDCLIYADILEHLADPLAVLRRHVNLLRSGGTVIISVPNSRHRSVLWQLFVLGRIRYRDAGILDRTHLRITTRRTAAEWLLDCGLTPVACQYNISKRRWKLVSLCLLGLAREFIAEQVIVVGRKA